MYENTIIIRLAFIADGESFESAKLIHADRRAIALELFNGEMNSGIAQVDAGRPAP